MTSSPDPYMAGVSWPRTPGGRMGAKKGPSTRIYIGERSFTAREGDDYPPPVRSRLGNDAWEGVRVGAKKRP
jgi:hypothetical protein